jgi:uncharacterized protein (TIGR02271 family)
MIVNVSYHRQCIARGYLSLLGRGDLMKEKSKNVKTDEVSEDETTRVIPVIQEKLVAGKRIVETGITRIRKEIHEREETVDLPLMKDEVHVERVLVDQFVEEPPEVRHVGETLIVPVMEEVLVVEKRLLLKEELHITKVTKTYHDPRKVTLRSEEVRIEHEDINEQKADSDH